jgi:hypothetical protein
MNCPMRATNHAVSNLAGTHSTTLLLGVHQEEHGTGLGGFTHPSSEYGFERLWYRLDGHSNATPTKIDGAVETLAT